MHGGVKFYRGSAAAARSYVEADHSRADDYYLAEGSGVAEHYAVPLDSAHEACADAVAAGRLALALAEKFGPWMPQTLDELHTRQIAWARAQAASLTEYFVKIGRLDATAPPLDGAWPIR